MQAHHLQTLYLRFQSVLGPLPDNTSLCLYSSEDRVCFDAYPQQTFGFPTSIVANVPQELKTLFALQATGLIIQSAIESATMQQHELDTGCGYSVRIVDSAADLAYAAGCCQTSAFVRADTSLWVWADSTDVVFSCWNHVARYLQSRFALLHTSPTAGLSGYGYSDGLSFDQHLQADYFDFSGGSLQGEGSSQPSADALSSLNEFSFLATVHSPTPPPTLASGSNDTNLYADPAWPWSQSESPGMGDLQLALSTLNTSGSPVNDVSYTFGGTPLTVNLATISPPPVGVFDLFQEEDTTTTASSCGISLGFSTPTSDGAISPASFSFSPGALQNSFELSTDAAGPFSSRGHSIGATSAPPPRVVGMKTKRDSDNDSDDYNYVDGSFFPAAAAATADTADAHTSKCMRADGGAIVKATSAPARFIVPLPNVEKNDCDDDDGKSSVSSSSSGSSQSLAPASASTSAASLPSPVPTTTSTVAPRRARRRAGTSGGSGGRAPRARRTKCDFCPKLFTRAQDAQRHAAASCVENPNRAGVRCPECGQVLSRQDSAQRHWRGHENPQCETPEWAHSP
ncbi:hypothetical protein EDB87DRAFT_1341620 [Lactarius vividus]|nr:hypothetical protein EDB87DRAFT_1341620 [Lactarius vividus]